MRAQLELCAWALGLVLLASYVSMRSWYASEHEEGIEAFERIVESSSEPQAAVADLHVRRPDMADWSAGRKAAYLRVSAPEWKAPTPEAVLRVPRLGIEVAVYAGTDEATLNRGAGRVPWTAPFGEPGNTGIAAHRDGFFRALQHIKVGDVLHVQTVRQTLVYRVTKTSIVPPSALHVLAPSQNSVLTLITCYPFYFVGPAPQRFVVQAHRLPDLSSANSASSASTEQSP